MLGYTSDNFISDLRVNINDSEIGIPHGEEDHDDHDGHKEDDHDGEEDHDDHDDHDGHKEDDHDGEEDHDDHDGHKEDEHDDHDEHVDGEFDAHLWLDPVNAKKMVIEISHELSELDPANKNTYMANADKTIEDLDRLIKEVNRVKSKCFFYCIS